MSATTTETFQPTHHIDVEDRKFSQCLESLRRWTQVTAGRQNRTRNTERRELSINPVIVAEAPLRPGETEPQQFSFRAWGRDLSRGGMSFVTASDVMACQPADDTRAISLDQVLKETTNLRIGLERPDGSMIWLFGQVVRVRSVHDGLLECGVCFISRQADPRG